jgi:hypothetical protein
VGIGIESGRRLSHLQINHFAGIRFCTPRGVHTDNPRLPAIATEQRKVEVRKGPVWVDEESLQANSQLGGPLKKQEGMQSDGVFCSS